MADKYARRTVLASLSALGTLGLGTANKSLTVAGSTNQPTDESNPSATWSQSRADPAHTGAVPTEAAPNDEFATAAWVGSGDDRFESDNYVFVNEPIVADGAIYRPYLVNTLPYRGAVVALDAETGEMRWRHVASRDPSEPDIGRSNEAPAVSHGLLFLASFADSENYGGLHALDTQTGEIVWAKTEERWSGPPLIHGDTLYVKRGDEETSEKRIVALDPTNGTIQWTTSGVAYQSGYTGVRDGTLYGMRTYTDSKNELAAWNASDGSLLWTSKVRNGVNTDAAAAGKNALYHVINSPGESNEVVAYATDDGTVRWQTTLTPEGEDPQKEVSVPAVTDEGVYVHTAIRQRLSGSDENERSTVYALDATSGEVQWTYDTATVLHGDPSVGGETVFVGGNAVPQENVPGADRCPTVHALATRDGTERWSYLLDEGLDLDKIVNTTKTPILAGGTVYAGIHAVDPNRESEHAVFALTGTDVAPEATNQPVDSDAPSARIRTDADVSHLDGNQTITLKGTASTGDIETYEWDRTDSGTFGTTGPTIEMVTDFCGSLPVTLRVTAADGQQSTDTITLSVV